MAAGAEVEVNGGSEYPGLYKVMMGKLNEQRQLDQFTDITLIVDGHHFRAHKAVLAACSQFFHKFFQDFTQEPLVEIEGVSNTAFCQLMEFTYTATLAISGEEEALDVWKAAEYLQMQEAIKALKKINSSMTTRSRAQKRTIAETSNVITETLPTVEGDQVEIEVVESGLEEVVDEKTTQAASHDSALALLADITSKYQQGEPTIHVIKKDEEEVLYQEETVTASKVLENVEVVEVQISQGDNIFRCSKCDRSFKLYYHLKQHLKTHLGSMEKPYVCNHCGKAYTREGALKQHISTFHFDAEELSRGQKIQKKVHICEYCKKQFDHFGHFKEHLRKHTGEKPYECPDCHERFARNSTLKCHMAACQNGAGAKKGRKKLYECQVCSDVFISWDQFKEHLMCHTGDKPNHCTMCDQWFTQAKELKAHLRDVHSIEDESTKQLVITDSAASAALTIATQSIEGAETVLLDDGIHVEHVTVEPMDVMTMEETTTVVVEDGGVGGICEEDLERLKQAGLQIQVVHVSTDTADEPQVVHSEVEVEI
ncbi:zinc finger protein 131 isoform X1 [Girardinichthys multiradiatus]|uniref:zinc finger protein 131 isoform X1 n=2 Tax=Girardinichthys multiradiatus TaxID=208333 RepID=UPI001FAC9673|nr:zinc finger protein 131 isoform X1 [Girardinichthys multiradiatus]XP_047237588.1 zinc finger protein 131 isoform X1 [Girardinichthys multiradiatus]XP_047237589.1 zinc finger protein 131 isoform X1 [Girardinichthys multiradiatus]XP_047237591.1 zinc finger protein 131 isoform X1 [Girardinichthys multiradiatus]